MKKYYFTVIVIGFSFISIAQTTKELTDLKGDYLGQTPPEDVPVLFAPEIVSGKDMEHSAAIFSPDGNEVFWTSRNKEGGSLTMYFMERVKDRWAEPAIFNPDSDYSNLFDPFITFDGKKLFFAGDRKDNSGIWCVEKMNGIWKDPVKPDVVIDTTKERCQASLTKEGHMYYIEYSTVDNVWTNNIVKAKSINGTLLPPVKLPESINKTDCMNWTPFIAPDESYLIFASTRDRQYSDLFISFYDKTKDVWSEPLSLGEKINTNSQETFPAVSPDGKYLFFTRWTNNENDMDVYWVSTSIIEKLKNGRE